MDVSPGDVAIGLLTVVYFAAAVGGLCVFLPLILLGEQKDLTRIEQIAAAFICGLTYWTALSMITAAVHFNDLIGYSIFTVVLFLLFVRYRLHLGLKAVYNQMEMRFAGLIFDYLDESVLFSTRSGGWTKLFTSRYWQRDLRNWDYPRALIWSVFGYAAFLRIYDPITHLSLAYWDPAVHLVWLKYFNAGDVYHDGIYNRGMHAFFSVVGTFSGLSPLFLIRYGGCVVGAAIPASLFFLLTEAGLPWNGALIGTACIAIGQVYDVDSLLPRQTASFPLEFAEVPLLIGLAFAIRYLRTRQSSDRWIAAAAAVVVWNAQALAGIAMLLGLVAIVIDAQFNGKGRRANGFLLLRDHALALVIGCLYVAIGLATGHFFFHQSGRLIAEGEQFRTQGGTLDLMIEGVGYVSLALVAVSPLVTLYSLTRRRGTFPTPATFALWTVLMFLAWSPKLLLGVSTPIALRRAELFLPLAGCGLFGWLYILIAEPLFGISQRAIRRRGWATGLSVLAIAGAFFTRPPAPLHPEYEESARLIEALSKDLPGGAWTVVGQTEEYPLVIDRGFSMLVRDFVNNYNPTSTRIKFPTDYMFIIYEKQLKTREFVNSVERSGEEARLADWVSIYAATHSDLHIYQESHNVTVYVLFHPIYGVTD